MIRRSWCLHPSWGDMPPPFSRLLRGSGGSTAQRSPQEGTGPQFGVHRAVARLQKNMACKTETRRPLSALGFLSCLPRTEENAGRRAARAVRACPPPHFILFPFQRLAGSPKGSLVCLLRGEVQVPVGNPSPGWGPSLPDTCPQRLGGRWAGGERSCACVVGREGGGGWTEGRSGGLPHHPTHTTVMGKRRYTLNGHKHDRQTCTLRPPGALDQPVQWGTEPAAAHLPCVAPTPQAVGMGATQPRSPRPGQTMSHGECVGPTG